MPAIEDVESIERSAVVRTRIPSASELRSFMRLVTDIVGAMLGRLPPNVLRDDLIAAGTCGLLKALSRDVERGPGFETYARIRIYGSIMDELRTQDWLTRSARRSEGTSERRFFVPIEELPDQGTEIPAPLHDMDLAIDHRQRLAEILDALEILPEREQQLMRMVYLEGMLLKEVAKALNLSVARVSQLHARAMTALRACLAA